MQQYFVDANPKSEFIEVTDKDTIKHMFQVMRLSVGDEIILVLQDGIKRLARLEDRELHIFKVLEKLEDNVELPINVVIACGFPKGDKFSFIAQKSTELGAKEIWGFPAEYSIVKWDNKKLEKLQDKLEKVVQGAAEQSKRNFIPEIKLIGKKNKFIEELVNFDRVFIASEEAAKIGEKMLLVKNLEKMHGGERILFIFGPEGGISLSEIKKFEEAGGVCIGLGPRIMRAETAPLYALSAVSYALEMANKQKSI